MNKKKSEKYDTEPEIVGKRSIEEENFKEIYGFYRVKKVKEDIDRRERPNINADNRKKKLWEPLGIGEKVLVLAERLKKKDAPGALFKSITKNKLFLNKNQIFIIGKKLLFEDYYYHWIPKEGEDKIEDERYGKSFLLWTINLYNGTCLSLFRRINFQWWKKFTLGFSQEQQVKKI